MTKNIVIVERCVKRFGAVAVIEECSFSIDQGSVFGLVGRNGAGKTTLIRLLLGLLKPDAGALSVMGFKPWNHDEAFYRRVGVALEHDGFSGNLNVKDNLALFAVAKGVAWSEVEAYIKEFWNGTFLHDYVQGGGKKVKYLSRGQRVQCGLCRAFMGWPSVYFFDEPTVALDVDAYDHFCMMSHEAKRRGGTMLISSHHLSTIEELCDEVGILDNKQLHAVDQRKPDGSSPNWSLVADFSNDFRAIIEQCSLHPATYSNGAWRFFIESAETMIPEIIARLAAAGCRILRVGPEKNDLKGKIRTHYENH
jgi:ABC-2 type transport system ATP-binding protein